MATTVPPRALLPTLLLLAALHALVVGLVRPLYQVSDEVNYLASIQQAALADATDPGLRECISPPDGSPPATMPTGGKVLFHVIGGQMLTGLCRTGAGDLAPVGLRLVFGLSLVVVTWAGWQTARALRGGTWVPAVTALLLATQPVLAKYAGAVTPDSLANAAAALTIAAATHLIAFGPRSSLLLGLLAATALAASLKDAALFLVPVHGLLAAVLAWPVVVRQRRSAASIAVATGALVLVVAMAAVTRTSYDIGPGLRRALDDPFTFGARVLVDLGSQLPLFLLSAWTSLGGFGSEAAPLPPTALAIVLAMLLVALAGIVRLATRLPTRTGILAAGYFAVLVGTCLLQAPIRQILLDMADLHQGRWLFPVAVACAAAAAIGLEVALREHSEDSWPLLGLGSLMVMALALASVLQWHVTTPAWTLERARLFLYSTGGLDIDSTRVAEQIARAWSAPRALVTSLAMSALACGGLLLACRPILAERSHVRHTHDR